MMSDKFIGKTALVIIDAQKEGLLPPEQQPIPLFDVATAVSTIEKVLQAARKTNIPVIHFQEIHRKEMVDYGRELEGTEDVHCLEGTESVETIESLKPIDGEFFIQKRRYSCFIGTDFEILLKGLKVDTLIVCGFLTDVCVHYTCADAHQKDYYVRLMHDAVRGSSIEAHNASLAAIKYLQTDSETNAAEVIEYLEEQ